MSDEKNYRKEKRRSQRNYLPLRNEDTKIFLDLPCDESMGEKESVQ